MPCPRQRLLRRREGKVGDVVQCMLVGLRIARIRQSFIIVCHGPDFSGGEGISAACCMCLGVCHQIDLPIRITDFVIDGIGRCGGNHLVHRAVRIIQTMRQRVFIMGRNRFGNLGGGCTAANSSPMSIGVGFMSRKPGQRLGYIAAKLFLGGCKRIGALVQLAGNILHRGLHIGGFVFGHCHPLLATGLAGL